MVAQAAVTASRCRRTDKQLALQLYPMSSDVSRRSSAGVVGGGGAASGGAGGKKMRKRKELDALTGVGSCSGGGGGGTTVVGVNRRNRRRLMCSSDSDSCSSSRAPTPVKLRRQITRRRKRSFVSADTWCSALRMFLIFGCAVWIVFETYTFLDIRKIQSHLQTQLNEVAAGNRGVPDDLQKCHAMSKQLLQNQTEINQRLSVYDGRIANLTLQVTDLNTRLLSVEKKISDNTDLISNPNAKKDLSVEVLSSEVAKLGSNYKDLSDSVKSLKEIASSLQSHQTILRTNITSMGDKLKNVGNVKTDESMINNVSVKLQGLIENTASNVTSMNRTLTSRIDWLYNDEKIDRGDIEKLKEESQKLIAQVKTIENVCQTTDTKFTKSFNEIDSKIISLKTQIDKIATNVTSLHAQSNSNDSLTRLSQLKGEKNGTQTKP